MTDSSTQMPPREAPVVGIDLGGTWLRAAAFDATGTIVRRGRVATDRDGGPSRVVDQIVALVREVLVSPTGPAAAPSVAVIGVPGPVAPTSGVVRAAANLAGWQEVPLRQMLEKQLECACVVENDANVAALAEYRRGAGRGVANFAYITVSTGIGAGLILDNRLYLGSVGGAGEFGHMVAIPDGPLCHCGHRGCINAIASGDGIAGAAGAESAEEVVRAAAAGDAKSQAVLDAAARYLGIAVGGLINLLALDAVALGGGVFGAGASFWNAMVAAVAEGSFPSTRAHCRIRPAELTTDLGLLGAFELTRGGPPPPGTRPGASEPGA
jgi:glucokinase